jgi:hypothetical protein
MRKPALILLLLLACYAYVLPRWADWNQNSRLNLVLAIVDDDTVSIDRYLANTGDYALYNGRAYTDKPPGLSLLALPGYMALSPVLRLPAVEERLSVLGRGAAFEATLREEGTGLRLDKVRVALAQYLLTLLAVATPAATLGALFYLALGRLNVAPAPAALGAIAYGLATPAATYGGNFYAHQMAAALLFGAFFVAWPRPDGDGRPAFAQGLLCGLLLGWAVISEYPVALPAAVIVIYALRRRGWRWIAPLGLGGALPIVLLMVYDLAAFGTPLPVGYAYSALWQEQHHSGFMSITYPQLEAFWGLSFSGFRGLFVRAPWLLLAAPGLVLWWRTGDHRAEWWAALMATVSLFLFYGSSRMWWSGFSAGPRYIVPLLPFLALPAARLIGRLWQWPWARAAAISAVILSAVLVWVEGTAGQSFPYDSIRNTWTGYVLPAWLADDIARNLGMALGLQGALSLAPLAIMVLSGTWLIVAGPEQGVGLGLNYNRQLKSED